VLVSQPFDANSVLLRVLEEEVRDFAIILVDTSERIVSWNAGARLIFGWSDEEIYEQPFATIFTLRDREQEIPKREIRHAREHGRAEDARWHLRKNGQLFFADGVTSSVRDEEGNLLGFCKIARDTTARHVAGQHLAAQLTLTDLLSEDAPYSDTVKRVMQTICENLHWDVGVLWEVDAAANVIHSVDCWARPELPEDSVHAVSNDRTFAKGEGLPGRVWESGQPLWIVDFERDGNVPRAEGLQQAGLRSGLAFPVARAGEIIGVMEFFSRESRDADGNLIPTMSLIGGQVGDYIERRRTRQALLDSEERYRVVSETAQDAIFTIDENSTITFVNAAVERVFGYKPEELIGRKLETIMPPRHVANHYAGMQRYLDSGVRHIPWQGVELAGLHRDGREVPLELSFGEWRSGSRRIFTGFARDITERKRAAETLETALDHERAARADAEAANDQIARRAEEEAAFRHLASALTGAVVTQDVMHEITRRATLVTRADGVYVERIVTADRQVEVVASAGRGTPPPGLRVSFPGSLTEEILKRRDPVILTDMRSFGKAMAPYLVASCSDCEVLVAPLVAENESLGALVLLNSRASGRRFHEADLLRAKTLGDIASLALRRVWLLEQERAAKENAETALRVRDETLGIVSHDLRNPLTRISLSADLMADAAPEEQAEHVEIIRSSARQMQRLIQDLLDVARMQSGTMSVRRSPIDTAALAREVCESNELVASSKKLSIDCRVPDTLPRINADRDRLIQVFGNLVGNAMKFTPPGGVITIEARIREQMILFSVRDSGSGIPESDLKNVFQPYWQAKKTAHLGAGLGLAIVRGIVEAHGGNVWAENAPGGGASFSFTIPIAE
jgi:PAS domain S-box-containing protein